MLSWLGKKLITYTMNRLNAGDVRPTLLLESEDITLRFPGHSSWSGVYRGKQEVRGFLERFASVGLQIFPDEVVVKGFPWNQTVCICGRDHLRSPEGELVYDNRYVIWGHMRWGRLREYEVYEDTEQPLALDQWLTAREPAVAAIR